MAKIKLKMPKVKVAKPKKVNAFKDNFSLDKKFKVKPKKNQSIADFMKNRNGGI